MDPLKGAEMLSDRLGADPARDDPASTVAVRVPQHAPPLFHWLGIEPSDSPVERGAPGEERSEARRRFLGRRP